MCKVCAVAEIRMQPNFIHYFYSIGYVILLYCIVEKLDLNSLSFVIFIISSYPFCSLYFTTSVFPTKAKKCLWLLSVRPQNNSRQYSSIATQLTYVNRWHPKIFPIENRIRSCYTFSTGVIKRNAITVHGRYGLEVNFSHVNIFLTERNFY